jgi:hypothetical protein
MSGGGGKGGSQTSAQSIPAWVEGPAKANLEKAKLAGEIGYMPYYGPEVAGLSPMQQQGMQRTQDALAAFGMAPQGSQYQSYLPEATTMGGVTGYSTGNLFDQAVAELALRNPEQAARYASAMAPYVAPPPPPAPVGLMSNFGGSGGDGFSGSYGGGFDGGGIGGAIGGGGGVDGGGYDGGASM